MPPDSRLSLLQTLRTIERARDRAFRIAIKRSFASWGSGTIIRRPFRVSGEQRISLASNVFIGEGSWLQTLDDGIIDVGAGCQFSGYAAVSAACAVVIEPDVLVARNVHILDHLHRFDHDDSPVHAQGVWAIRPVRIGTGTWIGANAVILPGVTIGRNAVVGANSIVRDPVPDRVVVAGAPARVISTIKDRANRETPAAAAIDSDLVGVADVDLALDARHRAA